MTAVRGQDVPLGEAMSNPQGLRPFDPYRTLQLHPAAPRDLVEKAYWLLASSVHSSPVSGSRIEELNAAYGMLVDDAARRSYDEAHGVRALAARAARSRSPHLRLFSAKRPSVDYDDYYHVLRIDSEADSRIIQVAYDFWTHGLQGARAERERIEEAYRTLSNPQLRAQYDARRGDAAGPQKVEITKRVHAQIRIARHNENEGTSAVPITVVDGAMTGAPDGAPKPAPAVDAAPRSSNGAPVEIAATVAASPDVPPVELRASVNAAAATEASATPAPRTAASVAPQAEARAADASPAPLPVPPAHPLAPATKLPGGRHLAEAQDNRLLQLREDVPALVDPAPAPLPAALEQQVAAATVAFIAGPRTGERIQLVGDVVTLGSGAGCEIVLEDGSTSIEPEHARLIRRGATYMFRDIAGHDTAITDVPLPLAVVMLENGDEIQIGLHRMRFATAGASERFAGTTGEAI
jgi:hypothetical protein